MAGQPAPNHSLQWTSTRALKVYIEPCASCPARGSQLSGSVRGTSVGTWGPGHFESDAALDWLGAFCDLLEKKLFEPTSYLGVERVMAGVETYRLVIANTPVACISKKRFESLRAKVLQVYDREIIGLAPSDEFKDKRRRLIEETFDDLIARSKA